MSIFAAKHPILAGMIAALLHAPILAAVAFAWYRIDLLVHGPPSWLWSGNLDIVFGSIAAVFTSVAIGWTLLAVGAIALWRFRSCASAGPVWLLVMVIPLQLFWQTILAGTLYYCLADSSSRSFLSELIGILDDRGVLSVISPGVLLAGVAAALAVGLAWLAALRFRRNGRWETILPALPQPGPFSRLAARCPVIAGAILLATLEIMLFQLFALPGYDFWDQYPTMNLAAARVCWLAIAATLIVGTSIVVARRTEESKRGLATWVLGVAVAQSVLLLVLVATVAGATWIEERLLSPYSYHYAPTRFWHGLGLFMSLASLATSEGETVCRGELWFQGAVFLLESLSAAVVGWIVGRWVGRRKGVDGTGSAK